MAPATPLHCKTNLSLKLGDTGFHPLNEQKRIAAISIKPTKFDGCGSAD